MTVSFTLATSSSLSLVVMMLVDSLILSHPAVCFKEHQDLWKLGLDQTDRIGIPFEGFFLRLSHTRRFFIN